MIYKIFDLFPGVDVSDKGNKDQDEKNTDKE